MLKRILIVLAILVVVLLGAGWWLTRPDKAQLPAEAVMGPMPKLSAPREQWFPTIGIAQVVGWPAGGKPKPAAGLQVQAFADKLDHPRWLYRLPNGDVLVAETNSPPREGGGIQGWVMGLLLGQAGAGVPSANRITLLRDADGDGVAETRSALLTGLNSPFGMALVDDWLYIANTDAVVRVPFKVGETRIAAKPEKVLSLPGGGNHWARNLIYNPDTGTLFITVGSSTNIAEEGLEQEANRANVLEFDPRTKNVRIYTSGMRNPNGLAFEPRTRTLWTVVNERDQLGSDLPPDYLATVELGANYGWPWAYWGGFTDHRVTPERPDDLQYYKRPEYALGPHVAALGLSFANEARLGPNFANGAFISLHGSWNRDPPSGYKVIYVPFGDNGYPAKDAKPVEVLTGFLDGQGRAQGRPVGVITDKTGALLVADDVGNVIWRVSAAK